MKVVHEADCHAHSGEGVTIVCFYKKEESVLYKQISLDMPRVCFQRISDLEELFSMVNRATVVLFDDFHCEQSQIEQCQKTLRTLYKKAVSYWAESKTETLIFKTPFCQFRLLQLLQKVVGGLEVQQKEQLPTPVFTNKRVVLVCDDDDSNRSLVKRMLELDGMSCLQARNGLEAIEMVKQCPEISLVLIDFHMPHLNGFEASKRMKEMRPELSIIGLSGVDIESRKSEYYTSGMDDFIKKPIRKVNIDSLLQRFLA